MGTRIRGIGSSLRRGDETPHEPTAESNSDAAANTTTNSVLNTVLSSLDAGRLPVQAGKPLPCRLAEFDRILTYLSNAISHSGMPAGALYISGMPGTGKTATVHQVVRELEARAKSKLIAPFVCIEVNGTKIAEPDEVYTVVWRALRGELVGAKRAERNLKSYFALRSSTKQRKQEPFIVLIIDELDYLLAKNQSVLYQLFEWPTRGTSRLAVIGISNTFELHLDKKIQSRQGLQKVEFRPYDHRNILEIVKSKLLLGATGASSLRSRLPSATTSSSTQRASRSGRGTADAASRISRSNGGADGGGGGHDADEKEDESAAALVGGVVDMTALELCAATVAARTGDVRSALAICRLAIDYARRQVHSDDASAAAGSGAHEVKPFVTVEHVRKAISLLNPGYADEV